VAPVLIEDAVREQLPCVSNCMLIGDRRKFLSMLITLKVSLSCRLLSLFINWPATMWGPAIVMVRVVCPSLSYANISKTKRDSCMVTRKLR